LRYYILQSYGSFSYTRLGMVVFALMMGIYLLREQTRAMKIQQQEDSLFISELTMAFAKVIDMKDSYTEGHSSRVGKYTAMLARELGYDEETVEKYYRIALLHDVGKIGIPKAVLNKPGKLTDEEYEIIKSHTVKGYDALKEITIMPELAVGARSHHERPDGRGYPNHLKAAEIPRVAQIIAVADCFDAMYSDRPYRKRMNFDKAVSIIREVSGTQLTPDVVDAFLRLVDKGEFRDPNDLGGGSMENIENVGQ
jgi:energy-coupling factor transport system substrate-specific component